MLVQFIILKNTQANEKKLKNTYKRDKDHKSLSRMYRRGIILMPKSTIYYGENNDCVSNRFG
jgi:hypothetical protein